MNVSGADIANVANMAAAASFIQESNSIKPSMPNSPEINNPSFGGMTKDDTIFDIVQNNATADNLGTLIDIIA